MRVKLILPALTEATGPLWRPIKYSLFPPLGLATLAAYLGDGDEAEIQDEHVEPLLLDDEPDLVVIQVYITSASRAYRIADHYRRRGIPVVLGGLHVTSLPDEAAAHADTIFLGPGEDTWPRFLADVRRGCPQAVYRSETRTLAGVPARRCISGWRPRAASPFTTGICTTRGTRCFSRPACRPRRWSAATGARIATSIAGGPSPAGPPLTATWCQGCGMSPTPPAGRSSSRCGIL